MIMVAVASVFAFTRLLALQQFGFALAVAVLLDGTILLAILLPACLRLAGEANWYFPRWLEWLPGGGTQKSDVTQTAPQQSSGDSWRLRQASGLSLCRMPATPARDNALNTRDARSFWVNKMSLKAHVSPVRRLNKGQPASSLQATDRY